MFWSSIMPLWIRAILSVMTSLSVAGAAPAAEPADDPELAAVPAQEIRIGGDEQKRIFLIGPRKDSTPPAGGYKLLVVLPGGAGIADFLPFVRRIALHALPDGYLVAQLVAPKWTPDQNVVWPTAKLKAPKMKFSTEEFAEAAISDVAGRHKLDPAHCYTLSWSSGGPAAYAIGLANPKVTGSFVAMSVYKPNLLAPLTRAKERSFYLYHSKMDRVCPFRMAEQAVRELTQNGAKVELKTYNGGHGWTGPVFPDIRAGMEWLEANHSPPPEAK
jgi:predicted esterase